jgi:hypothetical protein
MLQAASKQPAKQRTCCPSRHAIWLKLTVLPLAPDTVISAMQLAGKGLAWPAGMHALITSDARGCITPDCSKHSEFFQLMSAIIAAK